MDYSNFVALPLPDNPEIPQSIITAGLNTEFPYLARILKSLEKTDLISQGLATSLGIAFEYAKRQGLSLAPFADEQGWSDKVAEIDEGLQDPSITQQMLGQYPQLDDFVRRTKAILDSDVRDGILLGWFSVGDYLQQISGTGLVGSTEEHTEVPEHIKEGNIASFLDDEQGDGMSIEDMLASAIEEEPAPSVTSTPRLTLDHVPPAESMAVMDEPDVGGLTPVKLLLEAVSQIAGVRNAYIAAREGKLALVTEGESLGVDSAMAIQSMTRSYLADARSEFQSSQGLLVVVTPLE